MRECLFLYENQINEVFNHLYNQSLPAEGHCFTRQGALIYPVKHLIEGYYENGALFEETMKHHRKINPSDQAFVNNYWVNLCEGDLECEMRNPTVILHLMIDTMGRIEDMDKLE